MKQEANIYEIAAEAGVSIATVSRVINRNASVSEKSRKKVNDAIARCNYVPNGFARSLSTSISSTIGVVVPDINNPFFSQLLQGITRAADGQGLHVVLFNTDENKEREHQILLSMREQRLRGIIATPVSESDTETVERLTEFEEHGIPVVLLDRQIHSDRFDRVLTDDKRGVFQAVSELIRCGHQRIGIITGSEDSRPGRERLAGYLNALREYNIAPDPALIRQGDFMSKRAYCETMAVMRLPDPPTAIFSSNNMTTYGCLRAFNELGLLVGTDVSLIGFDDIEALSWLGYKLSVVNRAVPEMGERAMQLLLDRFNDEQKNTTGKTVLFPAELILRGSERHSVPL